MAPPRPTITPHVGVPKASFRKIQSTGKEFDGVDDKLAQQYGYNEVNVTFERPEHYIRYVDPIESELLTQVEYDMDEQDEEWLKEINSERYKEQSERISPETFEIIIDRLEKEWFELMKRVPKPDQALPSEDSTCAVCDDGEGENANAIVFCDGCNLAAEMRANRVAPPSPSLPPVIPVSPARSPKKTSRPQVQATGPPLVPSMIVDRIFDHIHRINFRKKRPFLLAVCKYWSLKREARRGAPLLKRLHLEPWATSTATQLQTDDDKLKYLDNLTKLKDDLERVLELADLVRRREVEKQSQAQMVETLVTSCLLPFDTELRKAYEKIVGLDRGNYFMNPVSRIEVPEYYTVIDQPMHWLGIGEKIEQHEYLDSQAFADDVYLVLDNAIKYNKKDTSFHRAALRIKNHAQPILEQFQQTVRQKTAQWLNQEHIRDESDEPKPLADSTRLDDRTHPEDQGTNPAVGDSIGSVLAEIPDHYPMIAETEALAGPLENEAPDLEETIPGTPDAESTEDAFILVDEKIDIVEAPEPAEKSTPSTSQVGDMEPYVSMLRMLQDPGSVADDLPFLVNADPLASFFSYEKPIPKPPPPPQIKQSRKSSRKKRTSDIIVPRSAPATHPQRVVLLVRDPQTSEPISLSEISESAFDPGLASTPTSSRAPKRKRQDSDSWAQVVSDVNPHESFMLFETGWVLPPGTTRNRRPTFPGAPKPGGTESRKQSKEPKRTRTSSSVRGDTQPPTIPSSRQPSQAPLVEVQTPVEDTTNLSEAQQIDSMPEETAAPVSVVITQPAQPHITDSIEPTPAADASARLPVPAQPQKTDGSSDLSELSDGDEKRARLAATRVADTSLPPEPARTEAPEDDPLRPDRYNSGTLVWAKQFGFPFYPAYLYEPTDPMVPVNILKMEEDARRKYKTIGAMYPVQFYDKQRSWTWVPLDKLMLLGQSEELDQKQLHPTGKGALKSADRKALKEAYRLALQDIIPVEDAEVNEAAANLLRSDIYHLLSPLVSSVMQGNASIIELVHRLNSPTHGAPSSQLQLAAMQDVHDESIDRTQVKFDTISSQEVAVLSDSLEQLMLDAESIKTIQQRIENRMKRAQKFFHHATAALAPINRFPTEVLARIFVLGKRLELNFSPRMSWVAQRWRNVALSTPELWNIIPLTGVARVKTYVSRSGSMTLDIEADLRTYRVNTFEIGQCLQILEPHRLRWRNVKILLEDHDQAQSILRQLEGICSDGNRQTSTCYLESIYFGVAHGDNYVSSHHRSDLKLLAVPSLKVVELLAVDLFVADGQGSSVFTGLTRLSLGSTQYMQLDPDFLNQLYAMPNLTELVLDQCNFVIPNFNSETASISLEKLRLMQLSLIPDEVVNLILTRVFAPNLHHFELIAHEMDGPSRILDSEMIRTKYTGLTVLKLTGVTSYMTRPLLSWLPDLSELTTFAVRFQERLSPKNAQQSCEKVLKALVGTRNQNCPKLRIIEIGVLGLGGVVALKGVLESRPLLRAGRVTAVLAPDVKDYEAQNKDLAWMQSHLKRLMLRGEDDDDDGDDDSDGDEITEGGYE
ncbi:enhancer of polycomb-like protein 1 [Rhizoctonia solani]|uniref:Enhancer of polycomb-like protein 1 n=2 Tax=Rhizoctonia solani TaxID=456999 RepID=A0A8H8SSV3_9AGAM|nr:enhancer of polycomb-like protein 1 [Rhizoctonia solani]QRW16959.1 enhancer of polycomb-like protein 1 [Rhizoctonia solani]